VTSIVKCLTQSPLNVQIARPHSWVSREGDERKRRGKAKGGKEKREMRRGRELRDGEMNRWKAKGGEKGG